ncbi:nitroreductase [Filimonas zeae]|uniref:Nitroreductase domain-containing protein n=1 Tax=Filimonas zeae TaxID=1737353 RepID=A0A917MRP1_9BACT|nr:nitroreductase family protein [Filimonas zeae]MDR6337783.1 nitroreductase [Filimonas zeae]GGH60242.1 hypothetical protein GCM10011379_07880 [Filimonas zeae]
MLLSKTQNKAGKVEYILSAAQHLADSYGLQPLKILVVKDDAVKERLQPFIRRQKKKSSDTFYIVFAIWNVISEQKIDAYISRVAASRQASPALLREDRKNVVKAVNRLNEEGKKWAAKQADIAVQHLLSAATQVQAEAAVEEVDLSAVDKLLNLPAQGLHAVNVVSLHFDFVPSTLLQPQAAAEDALFAVI